MIAIISDIHGNYIALKEVLSAIDNLKVKNIVCLGDIVGYYPQVNECCEELQNRNVKCVLGNHDWYMVSKTNCPRSKSANDCLNFQRNIIKEKNLKWLESLPIIINSEDISFVHGGWINPLDEYLNNLESTYFSEIAGNYFSSGHSHKQVIKKFGEKIYCNPGSVGQPRDNNYKAAFATFNQGAFELHRVDYNVEEVCSIMQNAGFGEYYYRRLRNGAENFF